MAELQTSTLEPGSFPVLLEKGAPSCKGMRVLTFASSHQPWPLWYTPLWRGAGAPLLAVLCHLVQLQRISWEHWAEYSQGMSMPALGKTPCASVLIRETGDSTRWGRNQCLFLLGMHEVSSTWASVTHWRLRTLTEKGMSSKSLGVLWRKQKTCGTEELNLYILFGFPKRIQQGPLWKNSK